MWFIWKIRNTYRHDSQAVTADPSTLAWRFCKGQILAAKCWKEDSEAVLAWGDVGVPWDNLTWSGDTNINLQVVVCSRNGKTRSAAQISDKSGSFSYGISKWSLVRGNRHCWIKYETKWAVIRCVERVRKIMSTVQCSREQMRRTVWSTTTSGLWTSSRVILSIVCIFILVQSTHLSGA